MFHEILIVPSYLAIKALLPVSSTLSAPLSSVTRTCGAHSPAPLVRRLWYGRRCRPHVLVKEQLGFVKR